MMIDEWRVLSGVAPALARVFAENSLLELEQSGAAHLAGLFREHGHPGFLIASDLGGRGGSAHEMAQLLRIVGARCPSLAIMMTMHQHAVAAFARGCIPILECERFLRRVAADRALVATAFAEGRPGADLLDSTVTCEPVPGAPMVRVSGTKRPCSMTHHADFTIVGVRVQLGEEAARGLVLVDTKLAGIRRAMSWKADQFAAADSNTLTFDDVRVPADYALVPGAPGSARQPRMAVAYAEIALSCLFQLMVSACYLGMASRLGELMLKRRCGTADARVEMLTRIETAMMCVYRLAAMLESGEYSGNVLAQSMLVGRNAAMQIDAAINEMVVALGAGEYLANREVQYLVLAARCIQFHPPSRPVRAAIVDDCYTELV